MKFIYYILPVTALIAGYLALANQYDRSARLEAENKSLRILAESSRHQNRGRTQGETDLLSGKHVDWKLVGQQLRENDSVHAFYLQPHLRLARVILAMSFEEFLVAIDKIEQSDLSEVEKERLLGHFLWSMARVHPKQTTLKFAKNYADEKSTHLIKWEYLIASAYSHWIKADPNAAVDWFLQYDANGGFTDQQGQRVLPSELVRTAIFTVMPTNPEAAIKLLDTYPLDKRKSLLGGIHMTQLTKESHSTWATLIRNHVSKKDAPEMITWPLMNWSDGDGSTFNLDETSEYMQRIGANNAEQRHCIMKIAEQPSSWVSKREDDREGVIEDLQLFHQWAKKEDPASVHEATLKALTIAAQYNGLEFVDSAALHLLYHRETREDAYLTQALDLKNASKHPVLVNRLISEISDPATRQLYNEKFQASEQP
ncbi:hypothetical protein NT6N_31940 [Oceaniferula spumae]|uniref:HEAT repeat domain-containing protein n=1 Tax=Oceaniferula spumae TaxID=2979115 RepID=A0AAT9FQ71_9BACT